MEIATIVITAIAEMALSLAENIKARFLGVRKGEKESRGDTLTERYERAMVEQEKREAQLSEKIEGLMDEKKAVPQKQVNRFSKALKSIGSGFNAAGSSMSRRSVKEPTNNGLITPLFDDSVSAPKETAPSSLVIKPVQNENEKGAKASIK